MPPLLRTPSQRLRDKLSRERNSEQDRSAESFEVTESAEGADKDADKTKGSQWGNTTDGIGKNESDVSDWSGTESIKESAKTFAGKDRVEFFSSGVEPVHPSASGAESSKESAESFVGKDRVDDVSLGVEPVHPSAIEKNEAVHPRPQEAEEQTESPATTTNTGTPTSRSATAAPGAFAIAGPEAAMYATYAPEVRSATDPDNQEPPENLISATLVADDDQSDGTVIEASKLVGVVVSAKNWKVWAGTLLVVAVVAGAIVGGVMSGSRIKQDEALAPVPKCKVENTTKLGDGICDGGPYNSEQCNWDHGDCTCSWNDESYPDGKWLSDCNAMFERCQCVCDVLSGACDWDNCGDDPRCPDDEEYGSSEGCSWSADEGELYLNGTWGYNCGVPSAPYRCHCLCGVSSDKCEFVDCVVDKKICRGNITDANITDAEQGFDDDDDVSIVFRQRRVLRKRAMVGRRMAKTKVRRESLSVFVE